MKSVFLLSLIFNEDSKRLFDLDSINFMQKLVDGASPEELTTLKSTEDWYFLDTTLNIFDLAYKNIEDKSLLSTIIGKLNNLYGKYIADDFYNSEATRLATIKDDEENYYSIISNVALKEEFSESNNISAESDYFHTHKKYLSLTPESNDDYAVRCKYIFNKIKFGDKFSQTLSTLGKGRGINYFSIPITQALSVLNELNPEMREMRQVMHWIKQESGYDCTFQGNDKKHLNHKIILDDKTEINLNCEFHLKIPDSNHRDNINHYTRVYFGLLPIGQSQSCFLLHCGEHL